MILHRKTKNNIDKSLTRWSRFILNLKMMQGRPVHQSRSCVAVEVKGSYPIWFDLFKHKFKYKFSIIRLDWKEMLRLDDMSY